MTSWRTIMIAKRDFYESGLANITQHWEERRAHM